VLIYLQLWDYYEHLKILSRLRSLRHLLRLVVLNDEQSKGQQMISFEHLQVQLGSLK
jgi:hypothetical protein